jgi:Mce-associated membrane protein
MRSRHPLRGRRAPSPPPWSVVAVALAVALLSLAVAAAALLLPHPSVARAAQDRRDALEAAHARTLALTSYDHRRLDEDFAAVRETATGAFAEDYADTTARLRATFEQMQAVATADVVGAGLDSVEVGDDGRLRAVAVVAVDQVIRTAGEPPRTERNRLRMVLVRMDGTWLVEQVRRL